jgi:hypothetical protein
MEPTPNEVVAGITRVLTNVIAPEVTSAYAERRLHEICRVLSAVNWNEVTLRELQETSRLVSVLADGSEWIKLDAGRRRHFAHVAGDLAAALAIAHDVLAGQAPDFTSLESLRTALDAAVVKLLPGLFEWQRSAGTADGTDEIVERLAGIYLP